MQMVPSIGVLLVLISHEVIVIYSGTSHCGHLSNKDTSLIGTLAFIPIVVILYKTELRTPLQSGQLDGSNGIEVFQCICIQSLLSPLSCE